MISQTVEYALRAITTIAQHKGQPLTALQISELTQVPGPYLSKLMQSLGRAGLVRSRRGLHGGFVLARASDELSIWEVIHAVEPFQRIHECPLGIQSHKSTLCPLHRQLDRAMETAERQFRRTTIADVLTEPGDVTPLCQEARVTSTFAKRSEKRRPASGSPKRQRKQKAK